MAERIISENVSAVTVTGLLLKLKLLIITAIVQYKTIIIPLKKYYHD